MSNDYLEFKKHLEHAYLEHKFNPVDRAQEYMKKDVDSNSRVAVSTVVKYINDYLNTEKQIQDQIAKLKANVGKNYQADSAIKSEIQRKKNELLAAARKVQENINKSNLTASARGSFRSAKTNKNNGITTYSDRSAWSNNVPNAVYPALKDIKYSDLSDLGKFGRSLRTLSTLLNNVSHSEIVEHASIAGVPSRLRSKMQSAIYKKTGYQSKGSYAGAPINAKQATTDQNKAVANARFSANIKSAIEACNRDAAEAQSVYVEAITRINNIVSRNHGEVNSIIRSVNEYNENVRNIRNQTINKKTTFSTVANGKLQQGVRDERVPVDANRQFISFAAGAQKLSANKYVYKPKMLLIDSDPGTYKEV